jgi:hypothetical protein
MQSAPEPIVKAEQTRTKVAARLKVRAELSHAAPRLMAAPDGRWVLCRTLATRPSPPTVA